MRAFYYLFKKILFNNLLSIHIHTCGEKFGGLAPKPLMSAAYGNLATITERYTIFKVLSDIYAMRSQSA